MGWVGLRELDPWACLVCSVSKSLSTAAAGVCPAWSLSIRSTAAHNSVSCTPCTQYCCRCRCYPLMLLLSTEDSSVVAGRDRRVTASSGAFSVQSTCFSVRLRCTDTGGLRKAIDTFERVWVRFTLGKPVF